MSNNTTINPYDSSVPLAYYIYTFQGILILAANVLLFIAICTYKQLREKKVSQQMFWCSFNLKLITMFYLLLNTQFAIATTLIDFANKQIQIIKSNNIYIRLYYTIFNYIKIK